MKRYMMHDRKGRVVSVFAETINEAIELLKKKQTTARWSKLQIISQEEAIVGNPANSDGRRIKAKDIY